MLKVIRFGKHSSCHIQDEYVLVGCFWKPFIRQAVDDEWDMTDLIGGAVSFLQHKPKIPSLT
jgi:hypothetical protein